MQSYGPDTLEPDRVLSAFRTSSLHECRRSWLRQRGTARPAVTARPRCSGRSPTTRRIELQRQLQCGCVTLSCSVYSIRMRRLFAILLFVLTALSSQAQRSPDHKSVWWSHVEALANDGMEGRNTGSPAHKRAAEYVAEQFRKAGLEPAGSDGYIQPVSFRTRRIVESESSLALVRTGKTEPLTLGEDANISTRVDPAPVI